MSTRKITRARHLRKNMTDAELKLWQALRNQQMQIRFRRQAPIGNYIVDFVSYEIRLIIELDGGQHNEPEQIEYDNKHSKWLESQGFSILRFWNHEVLQDIENIIEIIWEVCNLNPPS